MEKPEYPKKTQPTHDGESWKYQTHNLLVEGETAALTTKELKQGGQ